MNDEAIRKAAVLLAGLDAESSAALLKDLPAEHTARIREALPRLGAISAEERDRVIAEFFQQGFGGDTGAAGTANPIGPARDETGGVEMDESLARKIEAGIGPIDDADAGGAALDLPVADSNTASVAGDRRFDFLLTAAVAELAEFLGSQPAEIIGAALSRMPPPRAARLVPRLPANVQGTVLSHLAVGESPDLDSRDELQERLAAAIERRLNSPTRPAGLAAVEAILNAAEGDARSALLTALAAEDRGLLHRLGYPLTPSADAAADELHAADAAFADSHEAARESHRPAFTANSPAALRLFDPDNARVASAASSSAVCAKKPSAAAVRFHDLIELDDASLAKVFGAADPQVALMALAGAGRELVDRMLRRLPAKEAKALSRRLQQISPVRLSDLEAAQEHLAGLATQLASHGAIPFPSKRRLSMAA